jgi:hypothetical protein
MSAINVILVLGSLTSDPVDVMDRHINSITSWPGHFANISIAY